MVRNKSKKKGVFSIFGKMALREFKKGWAQFLSIVMIGAIAVTLFVGLLANAQSFESQVNRTYETGNLAEIYVTAMKYDEEDEKLVKQAVGTDGEVATRFELLGSANGKSSYLAILPSMPTISKPYDLEFALPEQTNESFCLIDRSLVDENSENPLFEVGKEMAYDIDIVSLGLSSIGAILDPYVKDGGQNVLSGNSISLGFTITGAMKFPENSEKSSYGSTTILISDSIFRESLSKLISENYAETITTTPRAVIEFLEEKLGIEGMPNPELVWLVLKGMLQEYFPDINFDNVEIDTPFDVNLHKLISLVIAVNFNWNLEAAATGEGILVTPNQYLVKLKDGVSKIAVLKRVEAALEGRDGILMVADRDEMPFSLVLANDVKQARQLTFVFPFVFFAVAILVTLTTTSQLIVKSRTQIGTLKSQGFTGREIAAYYVILILSLVFLGTLIGEIVGPILVPWILGIKYDLLYTLAPRVFVFPWLYAFLTAFSFLFITGLVTYLVIRKETKLVPAESMRPLPPPESLRARNSKIEKKGRAGALLLSFKMALRNIRVDLLKSFMVIVGVLGCTALLVCGYGIEDTINYGIEHDLGTYQNADVSLTFSVPKSEKEIKDELASLENIKITGNGPSFEPFSRVLTTLSNESGISINTYFYVVQEDDSHLRLDIPKGKVAIAEKVASQLSLSLGDEVTFVYQSVSYSFEIGLLSEAFVFNGVFVNTSLDEGYDNKPFSSSYNGAWLDAKAKDAESRELLKEECQELIPNLSNAETDDGYRGMVNSVMSSVQTMTSAIRVFAILLAIVVLYNLALLNFSERMRDIATLRVLGFSKVEIASSLMFETMGLTFVGVILGLMIGFPFMYGVLSVNQVAIANYLYHIYWYTYFIAFALTFVVAFLVNLVLAMRTNKVKMVESLKQVE